MASSVDTGLLSYIVFKEKRLRLAWFEAPNTLYIDANGLKDHFQVLFVAADVLALSNIPSTNHCRIHARFAKGGLATKISFTGTSLSRCPAGMWFYSIKGLFKVAFEYLSEEFQEFCLVFLKDWWISALSEPRVAEEITISNLKPRCNGTTVLPQSEPRVAEEITISNLKPRCNGTTELPQIGDHYQCDTSGIISESDQLGVDKNVTCSLQQHHADIEHSVGDNAVCGSKGIHLCTVSSEEEDQSLDQEELLDKINSLVYELLQQVECVIRSRNIKTDSKEYHKCIALVTLLTFYQNEILYSLEPSIFPLELLKQYSSLCQDENFINLYANNFGISVRRNAMLCLICAWLGDQFGELSHRVETNVIAFKKKHIGSIDNLPPATSIIRDIFPQCMSVLLVHWMMNKGMYREKNRDLNQKTTLKECELPSKRLRTGDHLDQIGHLAPLVQIILEFANRSLISGVAHVIYAQVLHNGT